MENSVYNMISDFYFSDTPAASHDLHKHNVYQMLYIQKGSLLCEIAGNRFHCSGPALVFIGNCEPHFLLNTSSAYERYVMTLLPSQVHKYIKPEILQSVFSFHPFGFQHHVDITPIADEVRILIESLYREWHLPPDQKLPDGEVLLLSVLLYRLRQFSPAHFADTGYGSAEMIAAAVRTELEHNFRQKLNLDALAAKNHISRYYLTHIFKKGTGYSPQEYLMLCRISYACDLLAQPKLTVGEIAEASGFHDFSNFSRSFRKLVGMTPSAFRKQSSDMQSLSPSSLPIL